MTGPPENSRRLTLLVVVTSLSLAFTLIVMIFGKDLSATESVQADAYSRSPLGHHALVEILRQLDVPVVVSRHDSAERAFDDTVLVLAEPRSRYGQQRRNLTSAVLTRYGPSVVVLPKWQGYEDGRQPDRLLDASLVSENEPNDLLGELGLFGEVVRLPSPESVPDRNLLEGVPTFRRGLQLISLGTAGLQPLLSYPEGVLIGRFTNRGGADVVVISDPDLISTHGLALPSNAVVAVAAIERVRTHSGAVLFDETIHGHTYEPSLWRGLLDFPLLLVVLQSLALLGLLLWLVSVRFGVAEVPPPAVEQGKTFLVENTAELSVLGGHSAEALIQYFRDTVSLVAERFHAPANKNLKATCRWLNAIKKTSIGDPVNFGRLVDKIHHERRGAQERQALVLARKIYQWRREMIDGPQ